MVAVKWRSQWRWMVLTPKGEGWDAKNLIKLDVRIEFPSSLKINI